MIDSFEKNVGGINGLMVIDQKIFPDERGYFMESYNSNAFAKAYGFDVPFVQDNQSKSTKGVLRGLHFQTYHQQAKLVRVLSGTVYDVAVDIRPFSPTYGKHYGLILSEENKKQFFIPIGFAHGFLVLSDEAIFAYKVNDYYFSDYQGGIMYNDSELNIQWPLEEYGMTENDIILSDKDKNNMSFKEYTERKFNYND